jgi:hypothetical protein
MRRRRKRTREVELAVERCHAVRPHLQVRER